MDERDTTDTTARTRRRRWPWVLGAVALLVALILILLPIGLRYGLQQALNEEGLRAASVGNVDFNPFTASLVVHDLDVQVQGAPVLHLPEARLEFRWWPLWWKRAVVEALVVRDTTVLVEQRADGSLRLGLPGAPPREAPPDTDDGRPWGLGIDRLELVDCTLRYRNPDLETELSVAEAVLSGLRTWEGGTPAALTVAGRLNGAALRLDLQVAPFAERPTLRGAAALSDFPLDSVAPALRPAVDELAGALSLDVDLDATHGGGALAVDLDGELSATGLAVAVAGETRVRVTDERLQWRGRAEVEHADAGLRVALDGRLEDGPQRVSLAGDRVWIERERLQWEGRMAYAGGAAPALDGRGSLAVDGLRVSAPEAALTLAAVARLRAEPVVVAGERVEVADLGLEDVVLGAPAPTTDGGGQAGEALFQAGALGFTALGFAPAAGLTLDALSIADTTVSVARTADGRWRVVESLQTALGALAGDADVEGAGGVTGPGAPGDGDAGGDIAAPPAGGLPVPVRVGRAAVTGDSSLRFHDAAVSPPFELRMGLKTLTVADLDSTRPDAPSPLTLEAALGDYGSLRLAGTIRPFAPGLTVDLDGRVEHLELQQLSAYTAPQLGYNLTTGHLSGELDVRIEQGVLDSESRLRVHNLTVDPTDPDEMAELQQQLGMPLDAALSMLRDKDGDIRLTLPVSGAVTDPEVELGQVINKALGKALKTAAVGYLKLALQPYGALITIAQAAGEAAGAVRLEPLAFAAGETALTAAAREYLGKVAGVLDERPALRLRLCGHATAADARELARRAAAEREREQREKAAQEKQAAAEAASGDAAAEAQPPPPVPEAALVGLASARSDAAKAALVSRHGVEPTRLFACRPAVDRDSDADPRVELML